MDLPDLSKSVAYCGLVCGLCPPPRKCDCRSKPVRQDCPIRVCCIDRGIEGCWECHEFPCYKGYVEDDKGWRMLCAVSVQYVKEHGTEALAKLIHDKHGCAGYHGPYVGKTGAEIIRLLGIGQQTKPS